MKRVAGSSLLVSDKLCTEMKHQVSYLKVLSATMVAILPQTSPPQQLVVLAEILPGAWIHSACPASPTRAKETHLQTSIAWTSPAHHRPAMLPVSSLDCRKKPQHHQLVKRDTPATSPSRPLHQSAVVWVPSAAVLRHRARDQHKASTKDRRHHFTILVATTTRAPNEPDHRTRTPTTRRTTRMQALALEPGVPAAGFGAPTRSVGLRSGDKRIIMTYDDRRYCYDKRCWRA